MRIEQSKIFRKMRATARSRRIKSPLRGLLERLEVRALLSVAASVGANGGNSGSVENYQQGVYSTAANVLDAGDYPTWPISFTSYGKAMASNFGTSASAGMLFNGFSSGFAPFGRAWASAGTFDQCFLAADIPPDTNWVTLNFTVAASVAGKKDEGSPWENGGAANVYILTSGGGTFFGADQPSGTVQVTASIDTNGRGQFSARGSAEVVARQTGSVSAQVAISLTSISPGRLSSCVPCPVTKGWGEEPTEPSPLITIPKAATDSGGTGFDKMNKDLREAIVTFRDEIVKSGGTVTPESGWRSAERQEHLYQIGWTFERLKTQAGLERVSIKGRPQLQLPELATANSLACQQLMEETNAEVRDHALNATGTGIAKSSAHTRGEAIDMAVKGVSDDKLKEAAKASGIYRPFYPLNKDEKQHWQLTPKQNDDKQKAKVSINGNGPVSLLLTDDSGRRIGYEPLLGIEVNDFGDEAWYSGIAMIPQEIILEPGTVTTGTYRLSGVGTGEGPYSISRTLLAPLEIDEVEYFIEVANDEVVRGTAMTFEAIDFTTWEAVLPGYGDLNRDGVLDEKDLHLLAVAISGQDARTMFDLNFDGTLDKDDYRFWVEQIRITSVGDANMDGIFNSSDLIVVFQKGKYETGLLAMWSDGDWNGDGQFDTSDLVAAFQGGGYEASAESV